MNCLYVLLREITSTVRVEGDCLRSANTPWTQIFILRLGQGTAKRSSFISAALCSWVESKTITDITRIVTGTAAETCAMGYCSHMRAQFSPFKFRVFLVFIGVKNLISL